jgi:hypothetical protein
LNFNDFTPKAGLEANPTLTAISSSKDRADLTALTAQTLKCFPTTSFFIPQYHSSNMSHVTRDSHMSSYLQVRAGWVGDLDRTKYIRPYLWHNNKRDIFRARYVNPIQERRAKNGPVGAEIAQDALPVTPPPKPKKEPKKDAGAASAQTGIIVSKHTPDTTVAAASAGGADAGRDAESSGSALSESEKQLRALRKKLRQIEIIEAKDQPTHDELDKASKKAEILAALANLQA